MENYQNCSVLCCICQLCTHSYEQFLKTSIGLSLGLVFVHLFRFSILCGFLVWLRVFYFCVVCFYCVRFGFFSTMPRDWLGRTPLK